MQNFADYFDRFFITDLIHFLDSSMIVLIIIYREFPMTTLSAIEELHSKFRTLREQENFNDDLDMKFISLWITFNAVYAKNLDNIENREHIEL